VGKKLYHPNGITVVWLMTVWFECCYQNA